MAATLDELNINKTALPLSAELADVGAIRHDVVVVINMTSIKSARGAVQTVDSTSVNSLDVTRGEHGRPSRFMAALQQSNAERVYCAFSVSCFDGASRRCAFNAPSSPPRPAQIDTEDYPRCGPTVEASNAVRVRPVDGGMSAAARLPCSRSFGELAFQ